MSVADWVLRICIYKIWYDNFVNHKQLETHGCVLSTVATDALVLKHQAISTHSAN